MATKAYVLIEASAGKARDVVAALRALEGVESADPVTGPYDIILVAKVKDLNAIGELVTGKIHRIPGVTHTVTCLAV